MRRRASKSLRGELIYLSERKLLSLARQLGVKDRWFETDVAVEGSGRISIPVAPGTGVAAQASGRAQRVDPAQRERAMLRLLDDVVERLDQRRLPHVDQAGPTFHELAWFRFHRPLRFGVGVDDSTHSVRELVAVDQEPVEAGGYVPGLLLNGSARHLLPPYRPEHSSDLPGGRSGSGSGHLFRWLQTARRALDLDPSADLEALDVPLFGADLPRDSSGLPVAMYRLFAKPDWMVDPRFPQLLDHAPCEGIAQASLITRHHETTVVMGSPLFMRARAVEESGAL